MITFTQTATVLTIEDTNSFTLILQKINVLDLSESLGVFTLVYRDSSNIAQTYIFFFTDVASPSEVTPTDLLNELNNNFIPIPTPIPTNSTAIGGGVQIVDENIELGGSVGKVLPIVLGSGGKINFNHATTNRNSFFDENGFAIDTPVAPIPLNQPRNPVVSYNGYLQFAPRPSLSSFTATNLSTTQATPLINVWQKLLFTATAGTFNELFSYDALLNEWTAVNDFLILIRLDALFTFRQTNNNAIFNFVVAKNGTLSPLFVNGGGIATNAVGKVDLCYLLEINPNDKITFWFQRVFGNGSIIINSFNLLSETKR